MLDECMHSIEEWIKKISFYRKLIIIFFCLMVITIVPVSMFIVGIEIGSSLIISIIVTSTFLISVIGYGFSNVKINKEIAKLKEEYEEIKIKNTFYREKLLSQNSKFCFLKGPEENGFIAIITIIDNITIKLQIMKKESAEELFELN